MLFVTSLVTIDILDEVVYFSFEYNKVSITMMKTIQMISLVLERGRELRDTSV